MVPSKIKKLISLVTAFTLICTGSEISILHNNSQSTHITVYADESDDTELEDEEEDIEKYKQDTDNDWVTKKDNWRHGIVDSEGDSSSDDGSTAKGSATGKYAIEYKDGTYYWYHQAGSCSRDGGKPCASCGGWSQMTWGSSAQHFEPFYSYGCEVYAISAIASNLVGEEITPAKFLTDMGCKITGEDKGAGVGLVCDTSSAITGALSGPYLSQPTVFSKFMEDKYGLKATGSIKSASGGDSAKAKKIVDETLDNGGMIWYVHSMISANHYVAIRYKDDKGYYLLDSCCPPDSGTFDKAFSWDEIWSKKKGDWDYMFGFTNPNPPSSDSGNNSGEKAKSMDDNGWQRDHSKDKQVKASMSGVERLNCANLGAPVYQYGCELTQLGQGGAPKSWGSEGDVYTFKVEDRDRKVLEEFAKEHFKSDWSAGQKVEYTLNWINKEVAYADGVHGPSYDTVWGETNVYNIFKLKKGQCLQYNGALAAMMCYLGFDAKEVMGYRGNANGSHWQHFWAEVKIGNDVYVMETGNYGCDGDWKYLCLTYKETVSGSSHYIKYGKNVE